MRVLHVLDHSIPLHSGYTFRTRNILENQRAMGWYTCHVTGSKQGVVNSPDETIDGLHFYRTIPTNNLLERTPIVNQWEVVRTLARRIEEVASIEKPDVLHAHSPALNGLAALRAGRKLGLPVVYECRAFWEDAAVDHGTSSEWGLRYRMTRALETSVFKRADAVTTICEGLREEITSRGIPAGKITVIPNAVDTESFTFAAPAKEEMKKDLGLIGKTVLGFIGSFYAYEGIPLLLEALAKLKPDNPDLRLLLVGGGPQEAIIREVIAKHQLEDIVVLTGRVPHDTVQDYYNLVDIFAYPRLPMRLTELVTPLKPLEAMAQGRLLVASDVGGHKELITDGITGKLFPAGDASALASAITDLIQAPQTWDDIRRAGRSFVENERTWANSVSRYQSVYGSLQ